MQAAGKEENPFLIDDSGTDMQASQTMHQTPQHQAQQPFAGDRQIKVKPNRPPARPPPPHASASPNLLLSNEQPKPKSAIDELKDSIIMNLNSAPSKQPQSADEWAAFGETSGGQNQGSSGSSLQSAFAHQQTMYSSPAKNLGGVCPILTCFRFRFLFLSIGFSITL